MAVYEVKGSDGSIALVECRTQKSAITHVANKGYTARTLTMSEVVKQVKAGVQIETIEEEKSPAEGKAKPILDHIEAAEAGKTAPATNEAQEQPRNRGMFQKKSA